MQQTKRIEFAYVCVVSRNGLSGHTMKIEKIVDPGKPVFSDKRGRRRQFVNYLSIFGAIVITILLSVFVISVLVNPFLPQIHLKPVAVLPQQ